MQQKEIQHYLKRFFTATGCELTEKDSIIHTTLTIEMDKLLMNRPFYWYYLEKTGGTPNPTNLHLTVDQTNEEIELIHFGSPRLRQIFDVTYHLGSCIRLYQQNSLGNDTFALQPWIMLNGTVSYICDLKSEKMYSYGINLLTGEIVDNFFHKISNIQLTVKIPDYCYTLSPLIKIQSGINRIQEKIKKDILAEDHIWAIKAQERWNHDLNLLENFYLDSEDLPDNYFIEKQALQYQYEPKVEVNILNGGLIYLTNQMV